MVEHRGISKNASVTFDAYVSELLTIIYEKGVKIHYPFYANSFPLPFYYSRLLPPNLSEQKREKYLQECDWELTNINSINLDDAPFHVFYQRDLPELFKAPDYDFEKITFANYFPKFIFTDNASRIVHFIQSNNPELTHSFDRPVFFSDNNFDSEDKILSFTKALRDGLLTELGIKKINLYTDTMPEAENIQKEFLRNESVEIFNIIKPNKIKPVFKGKMNNELNLYFCSGAYNMHFLKDRFNYMPFQFKADEVKDSYKTYNFLVYRKDRPEVNKDVKDISKSISDFHSSVFWEAEKHPENLSKLFYAYRELSKIKPPFKIFDDVHAYARCLVMHEQDLPKVGRSEEFWINLFQTSVIGGGYSLYVNETMQILASMKNIYSLLVLNHISTHHFIKGITENELGSILCLVRDDILKDARAMLYFKDYIKAELVLFIEKFNQQSSPIRVALSAKIPYENILHNLLYKFWMYFFENIYRTATIDDLTRCVDNKFVFCERINDLKNKLPIESKYVNIPTLKKSLNVIEELFKNTLIECSKDMVNPHRFFHAALKNQEVSIAIRMFKKRGNY